VDYKPFHQSGPLTKLKEATFVPMNFCFIDGDFLQIGQFDMVRYAGFPMPAIDAYFRKMRQSYQFLQFQ